MKARVIYLLLCAALLAGIVAADSGTSAAYQPAVHTLSANTFTYYAIEQDRTLCAWGDRYSQAPSLEEAVPILADIVSVDAGWRGCLAIDAQGRLWSVGEYMLDEPGAEPRLVMDHVADVSAGLNHFVFLTADGDVYVCGRNTGYPVEVDETTQYTPPVCVAHGAKAVAACDDGSFTLLENGDLLFCGTFLAFSTPEPVLVGQGFDDLPFGAWAVKGNDLYAVRETETPTGWTLTPEKRLTGVAAVYAGVVRMADGRFLALDTSDPENPTFRELALPEDITYACLSDRLLIQRGDGTIQWAGD